jgi:hypothetical protein
MEEAATPLPREDTTPPVTNIYFGAILAARQPGFPSLLSLSALLRIDVQTIMGGSRAGVKSKNLRLEIKKLYTRRNVAEEKCVAGTSRRDRRNLK